MLPSVKAALFEEGGKLFSDVLRVVITKPRKKIIESLERETTATITKVPPNPTPLPAATPQPKPSHLPGTATESDYRFECVLKHLGAASVLLKEAHQRAMDEGIGEGTAEKIMEAMNEHAGMEADLEKMFNIPEAKAEAERLQSGVRSFRRAAWEAKLPTGGGTKEDVADARLWNNILLQEAYAHAKAHPGKECVKQGM